MTTSRTLRPGLLVSLSARLTGGVVYDRKDLDAKPEALGFIASEKADVTRWETTKVIEDPGEYERAVETRNKARRAIASVCCASDFGLLCPSSREFDLIRAIEEGKRMAAEHNASATRTFVGIYVITGRVAQDDAEAARAIRSEVRGLVDEMNSGITAADPDRIRKAANTARQLSAMLTDEASGKVTAAIEEARAAAREIVKRVEKGGETAAAVVTELQVKALGEARAAFLDLDDAAPAESMPVAAAGLDLAPDETERKGPQSAPKSEPKSEGGTLLFTIPPTADVEF